MQVEKEYLNIIYKRFENAFGRITHAINQLDNQQIWNHSSNDLNSIGIIVQHLNGNLNQWICSAIGGEIFNRNRSQEFVEEERKSKEEILLLISTLRRKLQDIICNVSPESLLSYRRIQGFDETVMSALLISLTHFELHVGQVMLLAKLILGDKYKVSWQPTTAEQGK